MKKTRKTGRIEKVVKLLYLVGILSQEEQEQMIKRRH
ncbi:hypothetical protein SAMN04489735_100436 [Aneurinibacillus thermoaerophilus]|uniref:Uncharacterized protein n=1 Tax=Aneurinibacillus thermoaerophilus TaxID=143495 RepID=A0A1G7XKV5_ANETH|nr:hypothetical protein SAMN04489735_100436 [Aneurinibacillus thermoaerophilus]